MYRSILVLTNLSLWITTVTSIVALFAPFWLSLRGSETEGLYMRCKDPFQDDFSCEFVKDMNSGDTWFTTYQGHWAAGTGLMLILAICSSCLCCEACRNHTCAILIANGTFCAAVALTVTVILYGVRFSERTNKNLFDRSLDIYFDWGFYVAIIAAGLSILTFVLVCVTICFIPMKK